MPVLSRYLLAQIARPMVTTILVALVALLAERTLRVVDLVVGWRGSLFVIFEMLGYLVPHYMGLALPVAFFLGILLTVGRLSREGELAAIFASGAGLPRLLRPIMGMALVLALITAFLMSYLQPYGRYAYRAAAYALTNASFATLLQSGLFTTLGNTTYMVEEIAEDRSRLHKVFLSRGEPGEDTTTVTAESGMVSRNGPMSPVVLTLRNGLQQLVPAAGADGRGNEVVVRFRNFETVFGDADDGFRPRGDNEREMTLMELWRARAGPPPGVDPWEVEAELHARLVRILTLPVLPLLAIPLGVGPIRGQRSYGLVVGLAALIAFHQVIQFGEALVDNNAAPAWLGLWLPFSVLALGSLALFARTAKGVPDPRLAYWLDHKLDLLGRLIPRRRRRRPAPA
jgi:lipopolysaccharide export system permease protein